jgi:hypothetical protein
VWRQASASAAANASEVPQAELTRVALDKVIVEVDKIVVEQSAFRASKQMSTQRLQTLVDQGDKLTTVLKTIVKQHYGSGNDKLVEFGIQPFRARSKPTVAPTPSLDPGTTVPTPGTPAPPISQSTTSRQVVPALGGVPSGTLPFLSSPFPREPCPIPRRTLLPSQHPWPMASWPCPARQRTRPPDRMTRPE